MFNYKKKQESLGELSMQLAAFGLLVMTMFNIPGTLGQGVPPAVKADCSLSWVEYPSSMLWETSEQPDIHTEEECKSTCLATEGCWNIDYNIPTVPSGTCWFGTSYEPTNRITNYNINHFDLRCTPKRKECPADRVGNKHGTDVKCSQDSDCSDAMMCCPRGGHKVCREPVSSTPDTCPQFSQKSSGQKSTCDSDNDCRNDKKKCCPAESGEYICVIPKKAAKENPRN